MLTVTQLLSAEVRTQTQAAAQEVTGDALWAPWRLSPGAAQGPLTPAGPAGPSASQQVTCGHS